MTWLKFLPTPKCYRKISHLSLRCLNVIEMKGERHLKNRFTGPSDHRLIEPSKTNSLLSRWTDKPMSRWPDLVGLG